jgi:serine/threonine-protein kinase RsbW
MTTPAIETTIKPDIVTLVIPCNSEYISVVRLLVSGLASKLGFTSDDIDDLKMAVSEVCTDCLTRASYHDHSEVAGLTIEIIVLINHDSVTLDIVDHIPPAIHKHDPTQTGKSDVPFSDENAVREALIEALVDKYIKSNERGGTFVKLVKRFNLDH